MRARLRERRRRRFNFFLRAFLRHARSRSGMAALRSGVKKRPIRAFHTHVCPELAGSEAAPSSSAASLDARKRAAAGADRISTPRVARKRDCACPFDMVVARRAAAGSAAPIASCPCATTARAARTHASMASAVHVATRRDAPGEICHVERRARTRRFARAARKSNDGHGHPAGSGVAHAAAVRHAPRT